MTEEAQNIITTIKQMEASLDDEKDRGYDLDTTGLRVTFPLNECLREIKEQYNTVSRLHRERFEQVKKLVQALESYSSHLETSFVKIRLPPTSSNSCPPNFDLSPSYVTTLDEEFTRVYDEYNKRLIAVQTIAEEIIRLWSELGIPQAQTDSSIVQHYRDSPEQLGLHQSDLDRLKSRRDKLLDEKKNREKRLAEIKKSIEGLWDRLGIEESDRKQFLAANRGCGLRTINEFEDELARLNELKRQNLHLFVEDARVRLQELWDALYFCEEEMLEFTPAFSDVYSDALLSAHEAEIERLHTLKDQRAPVLEAIDKHKSLIGDRKALEESAADATRLMLKPQKGEKRDPGKLLREEKMRKRIAKELPKVAAALKKTLEQYEEEYGKPFLVHGQSYLEEMEEMDSRAPPPRSKTPNGLPPRPKTPGVAQPAKANTTAMKAPQPARPQSQPSRPQSSMRNHAPSGSISKTPTIGRAGIGRQQIPTSVSSSAPSTQKSPSKIPSRVPLGNLQQGGNSPERRQIPQSQSQPSYANEARTMGPPRAPPPRMRDLFQQPPPSEPSTALQAPRALPPRPASTVSSNSNDSSKFVRPMSPEDVYDDRERMSYMSTSLLNRNGHYQYHQQQHPAQPPYHQHQDHFHQPVPRSVPTQMLPPPPPASRQISNTSSNMTTGSTATSASENWETYSDVSEIEPERDPRQAFLSKVQMHVSSNAEKRAAEYGHMAPPPAKMIMHAAQIYNQADHGFQQQDENRSRVEGSEGAWSTEAEETY